VAGFDHVTHADGTDQADAADLAWLLWWVIWDFLVDEISDEFSGIPDALRELFTQFVRGQGPLPVLRVGRQPYGVLPVLPLERWLTTTPRQPLLPYRVLSAMRDRSEEHTSELQSRSD